jgi:hypothetical protein
MWRLLDKITDSLVAVCRWYAGSRAYAFWLRHRRIGSIAIGVCILLFLWFSPIHWAAVLHHSIKYDLVWWVDDPQGWHDGQYILATWRGEDPQKQGLSDGMVLTKRIGCRPGQHLRVDDLRFFCDGTFLGTALRGVMSRQQMITPFSHDGVVPQGKLFLIGDNSDSYDSRYFGFIDSGQVFGRVLFGVRFPWRG